MSMIDVTPAQIMGLWEQLMECLYNDNKYGGHVAEIYLYTVMQRDPLIEMNRESPRAIERFAEANQTLYELCRIFEERVGVTLWLFENPSGEWDDPLPLDHLIAEPNSPWMHRVHIGIKK